MSHCDISAALQSLANSAIPVLDVRPYDEYVQGPRLRESVHLPLDGLAAGNHYWLLPDRHEPLVVLTPKDDANAARFKECLADSSKRTRWWNVTFLEDSPELWAAASELSLLDPPTPTQALHKRLLFRPCKLLQEEIGRIEESLSAAASSGLQGSCTPTAPTAEPSKPTRHRFRAYEPGCGRARNLVWLAVKEHSNIDWEVVGLDYNYPAILDIQKLLLHAGVPPSQARLRLNNICPKTGQLVPFNLREAQLEAAKHIDHSHISFDTTPLEPQSWDMILCIRFLVRSFLPFIPELLAPGGYLLYCTFLDAPGVQKFGRPKGEDHLLHPTELSQLFGPQQGFDIIRDTIDVIADGREQSFFVARKRF